MKILVTGGAGYLGSVLVPKLLALGSEVTALDSFRHGVPSLSGCAANARLSIVRGDVRDEELLRSLTQHADAVVHLAALVGMPLCERERGDAVSVNCWASAKLVDMLSPDQVLVFPCTNSGYGKGGKKPVTEADPMKPLSLYGTTKLKAEEAVLRHPNGMSLRFATLHGPSPRMRLDLLVNDFVYRAMSDKQLGIYEPHYRRCVLHVEDAAAAICVALQDPHWGAWNVGAENVTKEALCEEIQRHIGFSWYAMQAHDPDQRDYAVSSAAFEGAFGWRPQITLGEGIAQLIRLYQQPFDAVLRWRNY